jgi:hypothetical protein
MGESIGPAVSSTTGGNPKIFYTEPEIIIETWRRRKYNTISAARLSQLQTAGPKLTFSPGPLNAGC